MAVHHLSFTLPVRVFCLLLVYTCTGALASSCPRDAVKQAQRCTTVLGLHVNNNAPSEFIQEGDGAKAKHACGNGDLLNVVSCLERILQSCKHDNSDHAHFLRSMIDIERARNAITYFCTNVRTYVRHADCMKQHHPEQVACAKNASANFQTQASATKNMDSLMRFQCKFYFKATGCADQVLTEKCSSGIANIVRTVLEGFEPPKCQEFRPKGVAAGKTGYDIESSGGNSGVSDAGGENSAYSFSEHVLVVLVGIFLTFLT